MTVFRSLLSYVIPFTRTFQSKFSGTLELTTSDGKTLLNSRNTNYSYGSLQRVMNFSLKQCLHGEVREILILGLGGGCTIKLLRSKFGYKGNITAIEIDPVLIELAQKEFHIQEDYRTKIICEDAYDYVMRAKTSQDLIIVDLFIDNKIPESALTIEFWKSSLNLLNPNGCIVFNTLCNPYTDTTELESKFTRRGLQYEIYRYVQQTNRLIIAWNHKDTRN